MRGWTSVSLGSADRQGCWFPCGGHSPGQGRPPEGTMAQGTVIAWALVSQGLPPNPWFPASLPVSISQLWGCPFPVGRSGSQCLSGGAASPGPSGALLVLSRKPPLSPAASPQCHVCPGHPSGKGVLGGQATHQGSQPPGEHEPWMDTGPPAASLSSSSLRLSWPLLFPVTFSAAAL